MFQFTLIPRTEVFGILCTFKRVPRIENLVKDNMYWFVTSHKEIKKRIEDLVLVHLILGHYD